MNLHLSNLLKYTLIIILTLSRFNLSAQTYFGTIFHHCRLEPLTSDQVCDKTEMINFIHKEILPYINKENSSALDIKIDFMVNFDGEVFQLKVNDFPAQTLLEKTFLFKQYSVVKIPNFKYNNQVSVSYLVPNDRLKDYDFKRINLLSQKSEVYKVTEEMPRFPGCEHLMSMVEKKKCSDLAMLNYIKNNLILPEEIIRENIKGTAVVQFIVEVDGWVDNIQVVREFGYGSGQAAIDVIESMNDMEVPWIAAKQRGINVPVIFTLPIKFNPEVEK